MKRSTESEILRRFTPQNDIHQNQRNRLLALATWSGMTALCGMAVNFWQLALARIGVDVGEAGSSSPSHSIIADMYPPAERATAMGIFVLGVNLGAESLRYALLCLSFVNLWAALHYFLAGRTLRADLARAHIDRE